MKLHKDTHTSSGKPIVYVDGNTYNNRALLKDLGFNWYGARKMWWMYAASFDNNKLNKLQAAGTDVSVYTGQVGQGIQTPQNPQPSMQSNEQIINEPEVNKSSVNTDKKTDVNNYNYAAFPVNPKIYEADVNYNLDGTDFVFHVQVGREQDSKRSKTFPMYKFTVTWEGRVLRNYLLKAPDGGRWTKSGSNYNEDEFVDKFFKQVPLMLDKREKSKLYLALLDEMKLKQRDPALTEFLKLWQDTKYSDKEKPEVQQFLANFANNIPTRYIELNEPGYEGKFPIEFNLLSGTLYVETAINDPVAPRPSTIGRIEIPSDIKNLNELNLHIDKEMRDQDVSMKEGYLKYLKSFAFSQEEKDQTTSKMKEIIDLITSNSTDTEFFKREMMKRGFVRPSKRGKRNMGEGMAPEGTFTLIIDDAAIRNHTFARGKSANDPDYFYTAIAYNLMRIKHNNISFIPILLDDAYRTVAGIAKRYGHNISATNVADYIDSVARALYADLTGRTYRSWDENWNDFYGGRGTGQGQNSQQSNNPRSLGALNEFVSYVVSLGANAELAKTNPKAVYRQLVLQHHPDINNGGGDATIKKLNTLYESLPEELKKASSWYDRFVFGDK